MYKPSVLTHSRLLIYYPVSALVTLFANILQNPQDARARSDLKLMSSMTEFLAMLCNEDGNVHCRRMASICKEFERIARVALDKAESEIKGKGKRKARDGESQSSTQQTTPSQRRATSQSTQSQAQRAPSLASSLPAGRKPTASPSMRPDAGQMTYGQPGVGPMGFSTSTQTSPFQPPVGLSTEPWMSSVPPTQDNMFAPNDNSFTPTTFPQDNFDMQGYGLGQMAPDMGGSFQQPFVPQDLWQMPMTLEWDWADFFGTGPGFDLSDPALGGGQPGG